MNTVLIVTYFFPPYPTVGSLRPGGLAKYLPEFGWKPIILTPVFSPQNSTFSMIYAPHQGRIQKFRNPFSKPEDQKYDKGFYIPTNNKRRPYFEKIVDITGEILSYPDGKKSWKRVAVNAASRFLNDNKIDAMISSSSPVTTHLIAYDLKNQYHIPWVADLRDLWTQHHNYLYSQLRRSFERSLEIKILSQANALCTVSDPLAQKLGNLHRHSSIYSIPNGFDPDDLQTAPLTKKFTITWTGSIYLNKHDLSPLFQSVQELIVEKKLDSHCIEIRFFGRTSDYLEEKIKKYNLEGIARQYGMVSREDALLKQRESQVLLSLSWSDPREKGLYGGKLFEYLAAQRPILAIGVEEDVISDLIERTMTGYWADNVDTLKSIIIRCYEEYKQYGQVNYSGKKEEILKYSHLEMAKKFALVLEKINGIENLGT